MAGRKEGSAQLDGSHWRGSPYDRLLKKASRMTPRSGEIVPGKDPAPTPNRRSRLSGVGYNGAPCPLRRLAVGGF